jgi:DNA-binding NtrC family response regulator
MGAPTGLLGSSDAFRSFRDELERVAATDVTVLLEGEHGVGKSRVARALHEHGARADGPFVEVQLAALSPSLLEAELFGHEEGAFTGAHRAREGRFRRAAGGTVVLDAVEGIPNDLQVKLLRVLQERVVEPLGGGEPLPIDARVIATSGVDLFAEVHAGRFREDLYYRLAVVILRVPPLRARQGDLPALARALAEDAAARTGRAARGLSDGALERLAAHPWPGNVRELENALERVTVLGADDAGPVQADELDFLDEGLAGADRSLARAALAQGLSLDRLTLAMLEEALAEQRGNLSAAARRLGLSRRAFEYRRRKLQENGVDGGEEDEQ